MESILTIFVFLLLYSASLGGRLMSQHRNVDKVLRDFYLCTNLPIQAFNFDGYQIGQKGYNNKLNNFFNDYRVYERLKDKISTDKSPIITLPIYQDIYCTACYIYPNNKYSGLFILGPHSCNPKNSMGIIYKPRCLMEHLVSLLRIISKDSLHTNHLRCSGEKIYSLHVKRAIDYINYRYMEDISLDSMVDYLRINKSYFCSIFKEETGLTFTQFLNQVRIEKSKNLLLETDKSILDIALSVGFNNQNYFNILFKRLTDITPLEFKRKNIHAL